MGTVRLNITLDEKLEKKFRGAVADTLGFKKGNLQIAIEEALEEWIERKMAESKGSKR
jgi:hypothetical protein